MKNSFIMISFKNISYLFIISSLCSLYAVIYQQHNTQTALFNQENTLLVFDVDGVLVDRIIADLKNPKNIGTMIMMAIKLFFDCAHKSELLKTIQNIFKDRSITRDYIDKYDGERVINWLIQRYPALQQPTQSGISLSIQLKNFFTKATPKSNSIELLKRLHTMGYRIALATNQSTTTLQGLIDTKVIPDASYYQLLYTSDYGIESTIDPQDGLIKKPKKLYFKLLKEEFQKTPFPTEYYIFIDDTLENVKNAAKKGFIGIHFTSAQQTEDDLKKLGIL